MSTTMTLGGENKEAMRTAARATTSEAAIFSRVLNPDQATLSTAAAEALPALDFSPSDRDRMRQLSAQAREGSLNAQEQEEINNYERVGHILSLMKSKARRSLKGRIDPKAKTD